MHVLFRYDTIEQQLEQVAVQTMYLLYTIYFQNEWKISIYLSYFTSAILCMKLCMNLNQICSFE